MAEIIYEEINLLIPTVIFGVLIGTIIGYGFAHKSTIKKETE